MGFRIILYLISFYIVCSCQATKINNNGGKIKGETEIVFKEIDKSLNGKCKISGYVYCKIDNYFLESAVLEINDTAIVTDSNGFFSVELNPAIYNISVSYIGNTKQSLENVNLSNNEHLIILFKLGAFWIN